MNKEKIQEIIQELKRTKKSSITRARYEKLPAPQQYTAAVIDGGSAEIFKSPRIAAYLIRVYSRYKKRRKTEEFITIKREENNLEVKGTKSFTLQMPDRFTEELGYSYAANIYRRNEEIKLALTILQEEQPEIMILDGSLDTKTTEEKELIEKLKKECTNRKTTLIGFSKSCTYTQDGTPITTLLDEDAPITKWSAEYKEATFVKLHAKSPTPFRIDIHGDKKKALSYLHWNAKDIATPGYPYILIEADKMAQVTRREQEKIRFTIHVYSNETYKKEEETLKYHETMNRF